MMLPCLKTHRSTRESGETTKVQSRSIEEQAQYPQGVIEATCSFTVLGPWKRAAGFNKY
jgi:hypothetical protein